MAEGYNLGDAVLVIGVLWLGFTFGFSWWMTGLSVLSVVLLLVAWAYPGFVHEREALLEAETDYYRAKAEYYRRREAK